MADTFHRSFFLKGQAGRIEAMLWTTPQANPRLAAVVCHPHPLFGGTMHNKVVFQAAKALHRHGVPVLRFNFRGAGLSEGVHDRGEGEREDVRTALNYLAEEFPGLSILLAGFSFGSQVGLEVGCADSRVKDLIALGIPVDNSNMSNCFFTHCRSPRSCYSLKTPTTFSPGISLKWLRPSTAGLSRGIPNWSATPRDSSFSIRIV
jgi:alpha/beta superfamily hydrolase